MNAPVVRLLPTTIVVIAALLGLKSLELVRAATPPNAGLQAKPATVTPSQSPPENQSPPISDAERHLLLDLRQRRDQLDERERALSQREIMMTAAEQKLDQRITELQALQKRLDALSSERQQNEDAAWASLVRLYEAMKPRDAAAIFDDLDMPVLIQLTDRMNERKAAAILAAMQPDRARDLTARLAKSRVKREGGT